MDVKQALEMLEEYQTYWSDIYRKAEEDLRFASPNGDQWSEEDRRLRGQRPCINVNVLPQFIHQVTNQIRQNTPSINVLPSDQTSSPETAKVLKGLIRNIEYRSGADEVYDTAAEYAVSASIGFIRVDHDYVSSDSWQQELLIKRVQNPLAVWIDPSSVECDGCDAKGAICIDSITKAAFEKRWPGKAFVSFESNAQHDDKRESITIGEIFKLEYEDIKNQGAAPNEKTKRKLQKAVIRRYIFSGHDLLEETIFPGEYIPVIPAYGQELWVDGKRNLISLIRGAKDPQRRYNHWASVEAEILSKAPIAPIMAAVGQIDDWAQDYQNPSRNMVLTYNTTDADGNPVAMPQRLQPVSVPTGIINAMQGAYEDIKRSMGLYDASVGQKSNETSGVAIDARKQQGDVATFHFVDNLSRSIAQVGRVLISATPTIYDLPQVLQIVGEEDNQQAVGVNGAEMQKGQKEPIDLTKGKYDVRVTTGPSFTSKRQESSAKLGQLIEARPELIGVFGDLWAKTLDVPNAEAIAARIRKTIPKELTAEEDAQKEGGEAPDAEKMQMGQIIQQLQGQIQEMGAALEEKQSEQQAKMQDAAIKQGDQQLKAHEIDVKAQNEQAKLENERLKLQLDAERLQLERDKMIIDMQMQQQAAQQVIAQPAAMPSGIKLDTTGFQFMKTPEQEAMEAEEKAREIAESQAEMQQKALIAEREAMERQQLLDVLINIAQGVNALTDKVGRPVQVVRDASGAIAGAAPVGTTLN